MMRRKHAMPVLETLSARAGETEGECLKDTVVLHINHCMDNSFYFSRILDRLFLHAVFVGVPYNDMPVEGEWDFTLYYGRRRRDCYELRQGSRCFFKGSMDFMEAVERLIEAALEETVLPWLNEGKRLLILEDGGYHYPVLRRFLEKYPERKGQVCGSVEQTASGTVRCREFGKKYGYAYPCASISRSDVKMYIESRFIGHRVVEELAGFLYTANAFLDFHHVLLLGYGIVGRQVAMDLDSRRCRISVYETDERVRRTAAADGHDVVDVIDEEIFSADTIMIGNTGAAAFTGEMLAAFFRGKAKRLYLASSSSQDKEFEVFLHMIRGKEPLPEGAVCAGHEDEEFYSRYVFEYFGRVKQVYLIAEGLPVNFYRKDGISLTYSVIDLVFAEMLSVGLAFHSGKWENKLWLLGSGETSPCLLSEDELARLWFSEYGLTGWTEAEGMPKGHPQGEHLRNLMFFGQDGGMI